MLALPLVSDIIDNAGDLAFIKMEVTPSAYECAVVYCLQIYIIDSLVVKTP